MKDDQPNAEEMKDRMLSRLGKKPEILDKIKERLEDDSIVDEDGNVVEE